jgi:hypothetical protein
MAKGVDLDVRAGTVGDVPLLLSLFRAMATFEKLTVSATEESLRAALFGDAPAARTLLAFVNGKPAAYVVYFFTFSTMLEKRGLWLEDLRTSRGRMSAGVSSGACSTGMSRQSAFTSVSAPPCWRTGGSAASTRGRSRT